MENALVPFQQLEAMAKVMGRGKLFGKTPEELLPLMLIAQAEGKHPAIAAQEYDIIQNQPAIKSKAALARFQASGGRIEWKKREDAEVEAIFSHPNAAPVAIKWTIKDAERAGLTGKDNWRKYPRQMLSARVIAEGVRASFPACLSGMYTEEEVRDFDNVQPPESGSEPEMRPAEDQETQAAPESREAIEAGMKSLNAELAEIMGEKIGEEDAFSAEEKTLARDKIKGLKIKTEDREYLASVVREYRAKLDERKAGK